LSARQRVVDALVVVGVARLAPYSEWKPCVKPSDDSFAHGVCDTGIFNHLQTGVIKVAERCN